MALTFACPPRSGVRIGAGKAPHVRDLPLPVSDLFAMLSALLPTLAFASQVLPPDGEGIHTLRLSNDVDVALMTLAAGWSLE